MKYPKFRVVWDSPSGEPPPGARLLGRLAGRMRGAVQRTHLAWRRRIREWAPWLRLAGKAAVVIAALAFIVVVGTNQTLDTPPVPDAPPVDAPSGAWSPDSGVSMPAPWGLSIPQIRTPGPALPTVHVGFRDLPNLSATLEAGLAHAEIRGGTSSHGISPQVSAAVVAFILGFVAVLTTVVGIIRRWLRWWRGAAPDDVDASPATHEIDEDEELLTEGEEAGEPMPPADEPMPPADEPMPPAAPDAGPVEPLGAEPVPTSSTGLTNTTKTGTPDLDEATSGPPGQEEEPPQDAGARTGLAQGPSTGRTLTTPPHGAENHTLKREEASSRVVLFTATKWD